MTLKFKRAIAVACLGLAAGVVFFLEPAKMMRADDDIFKMPAEYEELPAPKDKLTEKASATRAQKKPAIGNKTPEISRTRRVGASKPKSNPFEEIDEQDAFLNDLLSDEPDLPSRKTPVRSESRGKSGTRQVQFEDVEEIPRLKGDDELPEIKPNRKLTRSETNPLVEDLPAVEKKSVQRTNAERSFSEPKAAVLIPLVNLTPEETLLPQVSLNWNIDGPLTLGQETHCKLVVRNPGTAVAQQVTVEARLGERVKLLSSQPQGIVRENQLTWELGNLQSGAEVILETVFIPEQAGELPFSAIVKLGSGSVTRFVVEEPQLAIRMNGESSVVSGEIWNAEVTLMNPGTGAVRSARLEGQLPEGVLYEGESQISLEVGEIPAGESRRITLPLTCSGGGEHQLSLKASGLAVPARESELSWQVLAPDLQITSEGPSRRFVSRPAQYSFSLVNNGTTIAENVRVACVVPVGFELKEVGQNGQYDEQSNTITWKIDRIGEGETQRLFVDTVAKSTGQQIFLVRAKSDHGGQAAATCETRVDGISSVVLTVRDLDDPIEVGVETGYVLNLQNDGTQRLTDLELICELPPEVEFLSGTGPTEVDGGRGVIRIGRITELSPGQELTYQLKVRGNKEGSFRFQAKLSAPELNRPVLAEELTRIYED